MAIKKISRILGGDQQIYSLAWFRIVFGALLLFSTCRIAVLGWIPSHYADLTFRFHYYGFSWLPDASLPVLYLLHFVLALAALGVLLGYRYRMAALLQFLCFAYLALYDLSYYLNHYYFVSLVCLWLCLVPAQHCLSLDVRQGRVAYTEWVPAWTVWIFKFLVALVYVYAGLAKLNSEWLLHALPLRLWLPAHDNLPVIGALLRLPATAYVFSWAGMLFDTSVIFFLCWRRTRLVAFLAVVIFHVLTGLLFQIGVFPLVMIAAVSIFFSLSTHYRCLQWLADLEAKYLGSPKNLRLLERGGGVYRYPPLLRPVVQVSVALFVFVQVLFPWRYLFYGDGLFWSESGYRFSWRVMLMEKSGAATLYVHDDRGRKLRVRNRLHLNKHQEKQMAMQPDMILQYARYLQEFYEAKGLPVRAVTADVHVTLNGRPSVRYFADTLNLLEVEDGWQPRLWLTPAPL